MTTTMRAAGRWVATIAHLALWGALVAGRPPLPGAYFEKRDGRVEETNSGLRFTLTSDVDPLLILAERPFAYPLDSERKLVSALLAFDVVPFFTAGLVTTILDWPRESGGIGSRSAAWVGTCVFLVAGSIQCWCLGWFWDFYRERLAAARQAVVS